MSAHSNLKSSWSPRSGKHRLSTSSAVSMTEISRSGDAESVYSTAGQYISSTEIAEERTIMVYHPHAVTFCELSTSEGPIICVDQIVEPTNIEFSTKFRSSVDVSRMISNGDLVAKINDNEIDSNVTLSQFQQLLDDAFKSAKNKPVRITVLKTSYRKKGRLAEASTVKNALKWKEEQQGIQWIVSFVDVACFGFFA